MKSLKVIVLFSIGTALTLVMYLIWSDDCRAKDLDVFSFGNVVVMPDDESVPAEQVSIHGDPQQ